MAKQYTLATKSLNNLLLPSGISIPLTANINLLLIRIILLQ